MSDYSTRYYYNLNNSGLIKKESEACFGDVFRALSLSNTGIIEIFMYEYRTCSHRLSFSKEDIEYVFSQLSEIIEIPIIEDFTEHEHKGLCVKFNFENKSSGYVKTILTLSRYFFERYNSYTVRDLNVIIQDSINYSKLNPEIPFIEILQLFHYNSTTNSGHTLVDICRNDYPYQIVSNKTFVDKMLNGQIRSVNNGNGSLSGCCLDCDKYAGEYRNNFDKIKRI